MRRPGGVPGSEPSHDLIRLRIRQPIELSGGEPLFHEGKGEKIDQGGLIGSVRDQEDYLDISGRNFWE
jgi:hypothetical protein